MPVELPPPVDDNGDITVHTEEGLVIPIKSQSSTGAAIDISSTPYRFLVKGLIDKLLTSNPNDSTGKLLIITPAEANSLGTTGINFQLLDISNSSLPISVWQGKIKRLNW